MDGRLASSRPYLSPDDLLEIATAFQRSRVLLTAVELGIFTALGRERKSSAEIARRLSTDPRATDRLMNALCAMGLLVEGEGLFSNAPLAARFLVEGEPGYMAGLKHTVNLWEGWGTLTAAVRAGGSVLPADVAERGDVWREAFIAAMHYRALWHAPAVVAQIDCASATRLIDIGGGSGAYAAAFVRTNEHLRATVFDLPSIVPLTRKYLREEGALSQVDVVAGNYLTDDLGRGYDLAFLSAIIHSNTADENRLLIAKVAEALGGSGRIVIQDFIVDEDRTRPPFAALFALNMLVNTRGGDTYTEAEVRSWMREAGFASIERKETEFDTSLLIGRK